MLASTSTLSLHNNKNKNLPQITIIGRSRAGDGTCFAIPELKWLLDCGAAVQGWRPRHVFLTHTHSDHVHNLVLIQQQLRDTAQKQGPVRVYLPKNSCARVQAYLQAFRDMIRDDNASAQDDDDSIILQPVDVDEEFIIHQGGKEYLCRTVACHHRVECLGFRIWNRQKKLKEEFVGTPGRELGRLRKEGIEITTFTDIPMFCFLGDTTEKVLERYPNLLRGHRVVVIECSFIDNDSVERAAKTKHMHWQALRPYVEQNPQTLFVLIHFSLKYASLELRRFFRDFDNIHPVLIEGEVEKEWKKESGRIEDCPRCHCFVCSKGDQ